MTSLSSLEDQLKSEYGAVKGWIAAHVYLSVLIAVGVGFVLGKLI